MKTDPRRAAGLVLALVVFACSPGPASAVGVPGPLVEVAWLKSALSDPGLVILDLRSGGSGAADFAEAHIPRSVHAPYPGGWRSERDGIVGMLPELKDIAAHIGSFGVSNASTVVIVPRGSGATEFGAAARVYWTLKYLGHDDVAILDGGWNAWSADPSSPAASGPSAASPAAFTARPRPDLVVSTREVAGALGTGTLLVDARPPEQFAGTAKHPEASRPGHIPGAINVDQAQFYAADANRLKPRDELSRLLPRAVKEHDGDIIAYCNTGHWSATDWFVMSEVLGIENVRLYDASMVGWSLNEYLPIATTVGR
jgi:thiosulfate/3-mercaptopyruvate sulfurtransferase